VCDPLHHSVWARGHFIKYWTPGRSYGAKDVTTRNRDWVRMWTAGISKACGLILGCGFFSTLALQPLMSSFAKWGNSSAYFPKMFWTPELCEWQWLTRPLAFRGMLSKLQFTRKRLMAYHFEPRCFSLAASAPDFHWYENLSEPRLT
jgi:hypothetical protein